MTTQRIVEIENADPLAKLLGGRLKLTPLLFGLAVFFLDLIIDGLMCWHWQLFLSPSQVPGFLQDYMALTVDFVFNPVIAGTYLWITMGIGRMLGRLADSGVFSDPSVVRATAKQHERLFRTRAVPIVGALLAFAFGTTHLLEYLGWLPWRTVSGYIELHPAAALFRAPFWYLTTYATVLVGWNLYVAIRILHRLFHEQSANIQPLHLDRCGGLSSISDFTLTMGWAIGATGLMLSAATMYDVQHHLLGRAFPLFLGLLAYLVFAPAFFFLPLAAAHPAMRDSKEQELLKYAGLFQKTYIQVTNVLSEGNKPAKEMETLDSLRRLHSMVARFPVWPFDTRSLWRFLARVTGPVIPGLVALGFDLVRHRLIP